MYLCSENRGADQLRAAADLFLAYVKDKDTDHLCCGTG